jgi:hypothetical protein
VARLLSMGYPVERVTARRALALEPGLVPVAGAEYVFFPTECAGMQEAEEIARHCPMGAGIEIRPVRAVPA